MQGPNQGQNIGIVLSVCRITLTSFACIGILLACGKKPDVVLRDAADSTKRQHQEESVAPVRDANAIKSNASTLQDMQSMYEATSITDQLEKGKVYVTDYLKVQQVTSGFIFAKTEERNQHWRSDGSQRYEWTETEEKLWGMVVPHNKEAFDSVRITTGDYFAAVARFVGFQDIKMTSGETERLPVFDCFGIQVNGNFYNLE